MWIYHEKDGWNMNEPRPDLETTRDNQISRTQALHLQPASAPGFSSASEPFRFLFARGFSSELSLAVAAVEPVAFGKDLGHHSPTAPTLGPSSGAPHRCSLSSIHAFQVACLGESKSWILVLPCSTWICFLGMPKPAIKEPMITF